MSAESNSIISTLQNFINSPIDKTIGKDQSVKTQLISKIQEIIKALDSNDLQQSTKKIQEEIINTLNNTEAVDVKLAKITHLYSQIIAQPANKNEKEIDTSAGEANYQKASEWVASSPTLITIHIDTYKITKKEELLSLCLIAAESSPTVIHFLSRPVFKCFDAEDYEMFFGRVAHFHPNCNWTFYMSYLKNSILKDREIRNRIINAVIMFEENTTIRFDDFCIDQQDRLEIAKNFLNHRPNIFINSYWSSLTSTLLNFNITDEDAIVELAILMAERWPVQVASNVQSFNISKESDRLKIAIIVGKSHFNTLTLYLKDFNIKDENNLFKLASIIAKVDSKTLSDYLNAFSLKGEKNSAKRLAIAQIASSVNATGVVSLFDKWDISDSISRISIIIKAIREHELPINELARLIQGVQKIHSNAYSELEDKINLLYGELKNDLMHWLNSYKAMCANKQLSDSEIAARMPIALQIVKFENLPLRYALAESLVNTVNPQNINKISKPIVFIHLLINQLKEGFQLSETEASQMIDSLSKQISNDNTKIETVLNCLYNLSNNFDLTSKEKGEMLKHLLCPSNIKEAQALPQMNAAGNIQSKVDSTSAIKEAFSKTSEQTQKDSAAELGIVALQLLDTIILSGKVSLLRTPPEANSKEMISKEADAKKAQEEPVEVLKFPLDLPAALKQIFKDLLNSKSLKGFDKQYLATIGNARNKNALLIYAGKLQSLHEYDKTASISILKEFVSHLLQGESAYRAWRYEKSGLHFETIFKGKSGDELLAKWQTKKSYKFEELVKFAAVSPKKQLTPAEVVTKLQQYSVHLDLSKGFDSINACLKDITNAQSELKKLHAASDQAKNKLKTFESINKENDAKALFENQSKPLLEAQRDIAEFQKYFIKTLMSNNKKSIDIILKELLELYNVAQKLYPGSEFVNNIKDLMNTIEANKTPLKSQDFSKWVVEDIDHWEDLLLCGTEVAGSCQRITGEVQNNKCLLAYLSDGKYRLIAVKNEKNIIVGRCVMRLMWNNVLQKPVIFQERYYERVGAPAGTKEAIDTLVKLRAKELGLQLVQGIEKGQPATYGYELKSLSSRAPFEYVDAAKLGVTNGAYTIPATSTRLVDTK